MAAHSHLSGGRHIQRLVVPDGIISCAVSPSAPARNGVVTSGSALNRCQKMFTARAASNTRTPREIRDCIIISTLAQTVSAGVSVGENAVLVLKARNR